MWSIFTSQAQCVTLVDYSNMTFTNMADWLLVAETLDVLSLCKGHSALLHQGCQCTNQFFMHIAARIKTSKLIQ